MPWLAPAPGPRAVFSDWEESRDEESRDEELAAAAALTRPAWRLSAVALAAAALAAAGRPLARRKWVLDGSWPAVPEKAAGPVPSVPAPGTQREPLLEEAKAESSAPAAPGPKPEEAEASSAAEELEEAPPKRRRRFPARFRGRQAQLLESARKTVDAWIAALALTGVEVLLDGAPSELKLEGGGWGKLLLGGEVLPLVGLALRLEQHVLNLVLPDGDGAGERSFRVELSDADTALELALTLKVLRGSADTGAGIWAWGERPADQLSRPPPAE
mmetsp:Transcript_18023/g.57179  ORF Transcript_18023/g.57179 Transcript_18023/m.57179 type:complete len:273 (+) Transcript_18023:100-918(+)